MAIYYKDDSFNMFAQCSVKDLDAVGCTDTARAYRSKGIVVARVSIPAVTTFALSGDRETMLFVDSGLLGFSGIHKARLFVAGWDAQCRQAAA